MSSSTLTPEQTTEIANFFTSARDIKTKLEAYKATEEALLDIPASDFTTENYTATLKIWRDFREDRVPRLGSNANILPLLSREKRSELGVLVVQIRQLRRELHDLYVALMPRLKCFDVDDEAL